MYSSLPFTYSTTGQFGRYADKREEAGMTTSIRLVAPLG